jgi:hypothetical protein
VLTNSETEGKLKTFAVTYQNGKQVLVKRLPPMQLEAVSTILEHLFEIFFEYFIQSYNCLGDVLGDSRAWGYIEQLAELMPVVGQKQSGISLESLGSDYEQIGAIFLTQSINPETGVIETQENQPLAPCLIAQLHGQHFFRVKAVENYKDKQQKSQENIPAPTPLPTL